MAPDNIEDIIKAIFGGSVVTGGLAWFARRLLRAERRADAMAGAANAIDDAGKSVFEIQKAQNVFLAEQLKEMRKQVDDLAAELSEVRAELNRMTGLDAELESLRNLLGIKDEQLGMQAMEIEDLKQQIDEMKKGG